MGHFRRTQSPANTCTDFSLTFKFDQNLLQNVSFEIKANIFLENGCTGSFVEASTLDV